MGTKKSANTAQPQAPIAVMPQVQSAPSNPLNRIFNVGFDAGFGVTKALLSTGSSSSGESDASTIFPSVAAHAREIKFRAEQMHDRYPGDQITDDEGDWFMGDLANSQIPPGELLRLRGRTAQNDNLGNAFRLRLAKVALGKLLSPYAKKGDVLHVRIATGLPVDHMRNAHLLKTSLTGPHRITTDQNDFIVNIIEIMCMPQPYGTIYSKMLTPLGEVNNCHVASRTGVADIGTYTVDLALDEKGEYVDARSGSVEAGVWTAQERVASMLEAIYGQKISYRDVENTLRTGCFRAFGESIDFNAEVDEALEPLRSATLTLMSEKWQTGVDIDAIYISGGGASLIEAAIKEAYPKATVVEKAQIANARGYLNYAIATAQNSNLSM